MIALLAPGQGSQAPGMLSSWLELPGAAERVAGWSELVGLDLARLGTTAEADEIKDTAITQPLIVAATLLAAEELARRVELPADAVIAGHSIGEFAAAAIAGVLSAEDALALAAVRGREMAAACELEPTGMAALVRGTEEGILARLDELGLVAANRNGAGQIVAAGSKAALEKLAAEPPQGAKAITLKVAGAFHTHFMAPAQEALREHAATLATPADPTRALLSNADGAVVTSGAEVLERLVAQVTSPVRWDRCQATLAERGVGAIVEFPPAGALVGLAKRELKGVPTVALKTPDDLDAVLELVGGAA
ncbi:ACP S-malonyltransferase [Actinokineospora globicatena]|uniref:ACP S-malonyltransferase n=1 Tax=Actinokineospora globicatena TaxID=103729 RepID=UPI0020A47961|nr:ACP S-malonyltransferase [Actinokineospora globicatena]GLW80855.1 malonyl CoA-acyl carrier protein transacylase [Actinokineospora globicatena]GLW87682.1 malonyl CoA-acyl carrier protein transacylase [Actinokineospora globicatena]